MLRSKVAIAFIAIMLLLGGCVTEYDLGDIYEHEGDVSVSGWITTMPGRQEISLSRSSHLQLQIPTPLEGCVVRVEDDKGRSFDYRELADGKYVYDFSEGDVLPGNAYRVVFVTAEGKVYESEYERILRAPEAGDIYYEKEEAETYQPGVRIPGLRFFTDFSAEEGSASYFRIEVYETYKFHTAFTEVYWMYNGVWDELPQDSLRPLCYRTEKVPEIFLISGKQLDVAKIDRFPLHFTSNQSQKLLNGQSLETRVSALSESAYEYWRNQKSVLEESGGLFETQPPVARGNVYCVDDPEEKVLGYFGASEVKNNRIFVPSNILELYDIYPYCEPVPVDGYYLQRLRRMGQGVAFFVFYPDPNGIVTEHVITKACFDCTAFPYSTTQKPEYWEE